MLSVVIPTVALGTTTRLSSGKQAYSQRAYLLRCFLLPALRADPLVNEIVVVGEFEPGAGYTYVPCPNVRFDNVHDALAQRQAGFAATTGEWVAYIADDHMVTPNTFARARSYMAIGDVVSLNRRTRMRNGAGEDLNCGAADGYYNGHGCVFRRDVLEACPWSAVPRIFSYDVAHSAQIKAAGFHLVYAPDAYVEDVEAGAQPWL